MERANEKEEREWEMGEKRRIAGVSERKRQTTRDRKRERERERRRR